MTEHRSPDEVLVSWTEKSGQEDLGDRRVVRFGDDFEVQSRLPDGDEWYPQDVEMHVLPDCDRYAVTDGRGVGESASGPSLPACAQHLAQRERYNVALEERPYVNGYRIRIEDRSGSPAMIEVLMQIRDLNAAGWRLDKHADSGEELVFVRSETAD